LLPACRCGAAARTRDSEIEIVDGLAGRRSNPDESPAPRSTPGGHLATLRVSAISHFKIRVHRKIGCPTISRSAEHQVAWHGAIGAALRCAKPELVVRNA